MSDYSWNRTGEIDEVARTFEDILQAVTPPDELAPPAELEREVARALKVSARERQASLAFGLVLIALALAWLAL